MRTRVAAARTTRQTAAGHTANEDGGLSHHTPAAAAKNPTATTTSVLRSAVLNPVPGRCNVSANSACSSTSAQETCDTIIGQRNAVR